ncbi:MAG TPA: ATP-dependent metallopeptidase FtsH/Yme1/Tma family protein, partial [Nitrospiria bacterium]|nr:ATP-dependent metallopeptidase FtsH/Yme1/Tma family protein [Nitrospiria bacterium]
MEKKQKEFSLWYFVIAFLILIAIENLILSSHLDTLSYSDFKVLLEAGKVDDVIIGDQEISGFLRKEGIEEFLSQEKIERLRKTGEDKYHFIAVRVDDPSLVEELEEENVHFSGAVKNIWFSTILSWVVPAAIFFALWIFFMK